MNPVVIDTNCLLQIISRKYPPRHPKGVSVFVLYSK